MGIALSGICYFLSDIINEKSYESLSNRRFTLLIAFENYFILHLPIKASAILREFSKSLVVVNTKY